MHRVSIRMLLLLAAPLVLAVLALASTSSGGTTRASSVSTTAASHTLRTAFSADPSPLDPDTYYEAEGLLITTSAYEGLLRYEPNSPTLEGLLATSWKKSANGLTYTFQLRHGVRFSDGTPFNAAAAKWSFQRRIALKGGPSYMLANVKSMSTPGPYTFVVKLRRSTDPFLDYLASPYGPLMSSPTADKQHAKGKDLGSAWLASHTAGTGPYVLSSVQRATKYELTSNPYYWGPKPYFTTVDISVVPDFSTQEIELKGGQLDMVMHGLTTEDITALEHDSNVQVTNFPALFKAQVWVNPKVGRVCRSVGAGRSACRAQQQDAHRADLRRPGFAVDAVLPSWDAARRNRHRSAGVQPEPAEEGTCPVQGQVSHDRLVRRRRHAAAGRPLAGPVGGGRSACNDSDREPGSALRAANKAKPAA